MQMRFLVPALSLLLLAMPGCDSALVTARKPLIMASEAEDVALHEKALKLHHRLLTVDTHCDTPLRMEGSWNIGVRHEPGAPSAGCQDLPRMKEGGLDASFFAAYVPQGPRDAAGFERAKARALGMIDGMERMFKDHEALCERGLRPEDAKRVSAKGKRCIFIGMENGYPLGLDLANVDLFFRKGVRYITLCHSQNNDICSSSTDKKDQSFGLTAFGRQVVQRMNSLGMLVDVSHISDKAFFDVLQVSKAPVIASHSSARALCDHPRNLSDAQLLALKQNGGVIQLCILDEYIKALPKSPERVAAEQTLEKKVEALGGLNNIKDPKTLKALWGEWQGLDRLYPKERPTIKDAVDHIDHIVKLIGIDYVGIGTDFDGGGGLKDCFDVTQLPGFTEELLRRGYSEKDIAKIWGGNFLRVWKKASGYSK